MPGSETEVMKIKSPPYSHSCPVDTIVEVIQPESMKDQLAFCSGQSGGMEDLKHFPEP